MNVLDIGAHIGYYARLFSRLIGPTGRVYAFEPHPATYSLLCRNLNSARYQNVVPVQNAVSNENGQAEFYEMVGSGRHSLHDVSQHSEHFVLRNKLRVDCITIDAFLATQGYPEIHFAKIDIEGSEPQVLEGMEKTIARASQLSMVVELNAQALSAAGVTPREYLQLLRKLGFEVTAIGPRGVLLPVDNHVFQVAEEGYINLLCTKYTSSRQANLR